MVNKEVIVEKYSVLIGLCKSLTYFIVGTGVTAAITAFQGGMDMKQSLILGLGVGLIAGIKNFMKVKFGIDADMAVLAK